VKGRARNAAALLGAAAVLNLVGNVAFHTLAARQTNVSTYGLIATLLSLGFVASALGAGLQYAVARHASVPGRDPRGVLARSLWSCVPVLMVVGAFATLAGPMATYLHAASTEAVDATLLYFAITIASAVPVGVLMSQRRFGILAITTGFSSVVRVGLAIAIGLRHDPTVVALVTSSIATFVAAALNSAAILLTKKSVDWTPHRQEPRGAVRSEGVRLALLTACLWSAWLLPISFARHFLPGQTAGRFSVGSLAGTSLLYLASPVATAYFPALVRSRSRKVALMGLLLTAGVAAVGAVGLFLLGPFVFSRIFGVAFPPPHMLFLELGISSGMCSMASYLLWASRARTRLPAAAPAGVLSALVAEVMIGAFGPHTSTVLALSPTMALAIGGLVAIVVHQVLPDRASDTIDTIERSAAGEARTPLDAEPDDRLLEPGTVPAGTLSLLPYLTVGVMAHNEAATIRSCLDALLDEVEEGARLAKVVVVVSGSTDGTAQIVTEIARRDGRVQLVEEPARSGKVNAINLYLNECWTPLAGLVNADVVLEVGTLSKLADCFRDPTVGMAGGRPTPQNPTIGICNRLVHLEWQLHDAVAQRKPKLGEAVLFRNLFPSLHSEGTADEVAIEAFLMDADFELRYVRDAVLLNHGPTRMRDYVRHRQRIHEGHLIQQKRDGYTPSTMRGSVVVAGTLDAIVKAPSIIFMLPVAFLAEMYIRLTTVIRFHTRRKKPSVVWEPIQSAKRALPPPAIHTAARPPAVTNGQAKSSITDGLIVREAHLVAAPPVPEDAAAFVPPS
jgi:hypothetical protein